MEGWMDGHTLLKTCDGASKNRCDLLYIRHDKWAVDQHPVQCNGLSGLWCRVSGGGVGCATLFAPSSCIMFASVEELGKQGILKRAF